MDAHTKPREGATQRGSLKNSAKMAKKPADYYRFYANCPDQVPPTPQPVESLAAICIRNGVADEVERLPAILGGSWEIGGLPQKPFPNTNRGRRFLIFARFPDPRPKAAAPKLSEIRRFAGHFACHFARRFVCLFAYSDRLRIVCAIYELPEFQAALRVYPENQDVAASWFSGNARRFLNSGSRRFLIPREHAAWPGSFLNFRKMRRVS